MENIKELIKKIEKLGYVVTISKYGISIGEPFTSDITGEKFIKERTFATYELEKDRIKFLTGVLENHPTK